MSSLSKTDAHDWAVHIVTSLRGRWFGSYGTCKCPAHDDCNPSLSVRGGDTSILLTCHAGCDGSAVVKSLDDMGLWPRSKKTFAPPAATSKGRSSAQHSSQTARWLWDKSVPIAGTLAERYLLSRRFEALDCQSLRYLPDSLHGPSGQTFPCLIAAVTDTLGTLHGIHRTHLDPETGGKAPVENARLWLGNCRTHAVHLAEPVHGVLGLAEGLETADSAMALSGVPVWAALSTRNLYQVALPYDVKTVVMFADNGTPGHDAAMRAQQVYISQGRRCKIECPPNDLGDFNDVYCA